MRDLGEDALLRELRLLFAATAADVPTGIGDDAAVLESWPNLQSVWTTDLMLEGVHFQPSWQTPYQLGRKSLAVNLSDIASMAATPRVALISLALPDDMLFDHVIELCRGFAALAHDHEVAVVGGDTSRSSGGMLISVTAGGTAPPGEVVLRSGAKVGDAILVTGTLGDAAAGLRILEGDLDPGPFRFLVERFLDPQPRLSSSQAACEAGATSMTDISDGIASDLRHICEESGVGALLYADSLPVSDQLEKAAPDLGWSLDELVLSGGEDYELLFTLPGDLAVQMKEFISKSAGVPVAIVGEVMPTGYGIRLAGKDGSGRPMPAHGYDHFLDA